MSAPNEDADGTDAKGDRIAKVIARSGLCSRRDAELLIGEKRVSVNGTIIESAALDISTSDKVLVDGKPIASRKPPRLWRYYKPKGRVTTHKDPEGRPTVFEALPEELPRLISIGRLDFNTEGLLLLTNDGELARHLELPSTGWTRRYRIRAYGRVGEQQLKELSAGVTIGKVNYGPIEAALEREQGDNVWIALSIREGKNREVRRIMEHLALTVNRLIRLSFGPFSLGDLEPGQIEEVKTSVLKDQLGPRLSRQLGVKREPAREQRKLDPTRSKPSYLRRKPSPPIRPQRVEEEQRFKRRRILPMEGGENPKVEYVPEKVRRPGRFDQGKGQPPGERSENHRARSFDGRRPGASEKTEARPNQGHERRSSQRSEFGRPEETNRKSRFNDGFKGRDRASRGLGSDRPDREVHRFRAGSQERRDDRKAPGGADSKEARPKLEKRPWGGPKTAENAHRPRRVRDADAGGLGGRTPKPRDEPSGPRKQSFEDRNNASRSGKPYFGKGASQDTRFRRPENVTKPRDGEGKTRFRGSGTVANRVDSPANRNRYRDRPTGKAGGPEAGPRGGQRRADRRQRAPEPDKEKP